MKNKIDGLRLGLAIVVSPSVPIFALAITMWYVSGSLNWFPIIFAFGYIFFFLFGIPIVGMLLSKKTARHCTFWGGVVTIAPVFLLSLFSISSSNNLFGGSFLLEIFLLFFAGCLGGFIFWCIAFAGKK